MSLLFTDTETSDLLKKDLPLGHKGQPFIVELAAELTDYHGNPQAHFWSPFRPPEGAKIRPGAEAIHGISSRQAARRGVSSVRGLSVLLHMADQAEYVVGYGLDFDRDIVRAALAREGKNEASWMRPGLEFVCVMKIAQQVCKLPSGFDSGEYKWPTLDQACQTILGEEPREGLHSALVDMGRVKRLYFKLVERGMIEARAA